jgi:chromosomal replication initiator protein
LISGLFSLPLASADAATASPRAPAASTTEQFVAGPENALVRTLAGAVTAGPLDYNPIVLCGPVGVGKSSLAHALAARRAAALHLKNIITTTGADLARALAHAVETDSVADFRTRHQRCDLLLIDDLQQLANKPAAQQFLLTTFDALLRRDSLVIATIKSASGASPGLSGLMPTLASRLAGGLTVLLAPPGPLARRELVEQFASRVQLSLAADVLSQIASHGDDPPNRPPTAAKLRHVVLQLASLAEENHGRIKSAQVARLLAEESPEAKVICKQVMTLTGKHFGVTLADLRGKSRQQTVAEARGLAMYVARQITGASYAEIGRQFGNRDHTTVLHACRKFDNLVASDEPTRRLAAELATQVATDSAS